MKLHKPEAAAALIATAGLGLMGGTALKGFDSGRTEAPIPSHERILQPGELLRAPVSNNVAPQRLKPALRIAVAGPKDVTEQVTVRLDH